MAKTDQFDRMNTTQLEAEATQRGLNLEEFQSLPTNGDRAQRLRDHDAAQQADADLAQRNAQEAAQRQQQEQGSADQGQASDQVQVDRSSDRSGREQATQGDADVAPYSDDASLRNAQAAADGRLVTDEGIDTSKVEQVGGDPDYTADRDTPSGQQPESGPDK